MFCSRLVLVSLTIVIYSVNLGCSATLAPDEVDALKQIGKTLGKNWNFDVDPCSEGGNWSIPNAPEGSENAVICNCTFVNNTICHVVTIALKSQSLQGTVPGELVRLPYLQTISLLGNRITGPIPGEVANISTLSDL
ncbi:unnamed protein product [Fraxinus pennsylvanica]|uniref:LRR receptor-like serine/threonine-protein kinase n=1 Tax=Fraxinus pennsylvanica TaxID=56036 RepID=A0AAD2A9V4_9LAMI|nr:unnamed protein product [Fraxinus pennsylvanica]